MKMSSSNAPDILLMLVLRFEAYHDLTRRVSRGAGLKCSTSGHKPVTS